MNADVDRTIWDEWLTHVDKSYQDGWFKNGFWIPETVIQTQNANECIHFFLKKVGGLKLKDLDAMARLNSLEAKMNQLNSLEAKVNQLSGEYRDTQKMAQKNRQDLEEIHKLKEQDKVSAMTLKPTRVESVKSSDSHRKSPKRKKPNQSNGSDDESDTDSEAHPVALSQKPKVPEPNRIPLAQSVNGVVDKDIPWTTVVRRKPRIKTIVGNRENTNASLLGGSGVVDLVVSGIRRNQQGTEEDYCSNLYTYLKDNGIDSSCHITLLTKDDTKRTLAFKVTVLRDEKEKVFRPDFWPSFVYIRRFLPKIKKSLPAAQGQN